MSLVAASLYGFMYYKIKTNVDYVIAAASPYMEITYQSISNPMNGSIALKGIKFEPTTLIIQQMKGKDFPAITIDLIEFRLNSVFDFLFLKGRIENQVNEKTDPLEIMPKIQLKINHIRIDSDAFAEMGGVQVGLYDYGTADGSSKVDHVYARARAQGCGDIDSIDFAKYIPKLGYAKFDGSFNVYYEYDKYASVIDLQYEWIMHDIASQSLKASISNISSWMTFIINPEDLLIKIHFVQQDLGFNKRLIDFCAKKSGIKVENYVKHHIEHLKNYFTQANVIFSDKLYDAYEASLNQEKITITLMPESISAIQSIESYKPSSWPAVLGMQLKIGDKDVDDLFMNWDRNTVFKNLLKTKSDDQETPKQDLVESKKQKKSEKKKLKKKKSFVEVPLPELKNYVNSYAKIILKSGKKFKGLIVGDEENSITLKVKIQGGSIEMQMNYEKIKEASIYK